MHVSAGVEISQVWRVLINVSNINRYTKCIFDSRLFWDILD
jgi:hypothetical protein